MPNSRTRSGPDIRSQHLVLKPVGVRNPEAAQKVMRGKRKHWACSFSGSVFYDHSLIAAVQVAKPIIVASGKPLIAKLANVMSCPMAYSPVVFSACLVPDVTAIILLVTEIEGCDRNGHRNRMPAQLEIHLPGVNANIRAELFGSITIIATYPPEDLIREGVI
ncbi:hypothetical protein OPQ81_000463 [Rhizoctonia solani]|nr:hypothetical protein OPQ81_000463 [Rhizoctonia solani]